jgi:hypothetical protein
MHKIEAAKPRPNLGRVRSPVAADLEIAVSNTCPTATAPAPASTDAREIEQKAALGQ